MKLIKLAAAIAALSAGSAFAVPALTVPGGQVLDPFGGIDWAQNGTAYTTNFDQAAASRGEQVTFTTTFFAYANPNSGIVSTSGTPYSVSNLRAESTGGVSNPFELTTVATIEETGSCGPFNAGAASGTVCSFSITGGSFDIYLDTNVNARSGAAAVLSQYADGTRLIGGSISGGQSTYSIITAGGITTSSGVVDLRGLVDFTNSAYIAPNLVSTTAVATLQLGSSITNWNRPTQIVGASDTCTPSSASCTLAFQADANQSFAVPLPGTLALMGVAMAGLGVTSRRRARG